MQRRQLLRTVGAASALGTGSASALTVQTDEDGECALPDCVHPVLGYVGLEPDESTPDDLEPDHEVAMEIRPRGDEEEFGEEFPSDASGIPEFAFEPTGLAVETGDVIRFDAASPDHTVTAYHPQHGRQRRVPEDVPAFSSPVLPAETYWLYRFEESGVYDVYCAPHEIFGMAMRIVVEEADADYGEEAYPEQRGPEFTAATVLDDDALAPQTIADEGAVAWDDLADESKELQIEFADGTDAEEESEDATADEDIAIIEDELVVEEGTLFTEAYVEAVVENTTDDPTGRLELVVDWYDDDGNYLDDDRSYLQSLGPGEQWEARVSALTDAEDIGEYELEGSFELDHPGFDPEGLDLVESEMTVDEDEAVIEGRIENNTGVEAGYVEVIVKVYDSEGVVLGDDWTNETDIPEGETWAFDVSWRGRDRTERADDYEILIADSAL